MKEVSSKCFSDINSEEKICDSGYHIFGSFKYEWSSIFFDVIHTETFSNNSTASYYQPTERIPANEEQCFDRLVIKTNHLANYDRSGLWIKI